LRKVAIIIFIGLLAGGCALTKRAGNGTISLNEAAQSGNILEDVARQNITSAGFFIQKAEVEFNNQNGKQKFLASIKFEHPDKYLISIKSRTGIEGARIYITKDSVIVNDRINKKMYFGTTFSLIRKYGLSQSLLPLAFGDLLIEKNQQKLIEKCLDGNLVFNCILRGVSLNYMLDCKKSKSLKVTLRNNYLQKDVNIVSEGYFKTGNILTPRVVEVEELNTNIKIRIRYIRIEFPWNGKIKFVPGKGYELIELL
jgi:hypothetical protein